MCSFDIIVLTKFPHAYLYVLYGYATVFYPTSFVKKYGK